MKTLIITVLSTLAACAPLPTVTADQIALGKAQAGRQSWDPCLGIERLYYLAVPLSDGLQHDPEMFRYSEALLRFYIPSAAPTFESLGCTLSDQYPLDILVRTSKYVQWRLDNIQ